MESRLRTATLRMRRSSSKVAEGIANWPRGNSAPNITATQTPTKDFGEAGMERLRKFSRHSADVFRELVAILDERSELELNYAKSLSKLSGRLAKVGMGSGDIGRGWGWVEASMSGEAAVHGGLAKALKDDIVRPLKVLADAQTKARRAVDASTDKAAKRLSDARAAAAKAKKGIHALARDEEKLRLQLEEDARRPFPNKSDKQTAKTQKKLEKAEVGEVDAERGYLEAVVEAEKVREEATRGLSSAAARLRGLETQRCANVQTSLGRLRHLFQRLAPDLAQACHGSLDKLDGVLSADPGKETLDALSAALPKEPPYKSLLLADFPAEDLSWALALERRATALGRQLGLVETLLQRERRGQHGLQSLSNVYEASPKFSDSQGRSSVQNKLRDSCEVVVFLEFQRYKLICALASCDKRRFTQPQPHHLAQFQERTKDKGGLTESRLRVPVGGWDELLSCPESESAESEYVGSSASEWSSGTLRREAADGRSPSLSPSSDLNIYETVGGGAEEELRVVGSSTGEECESSEEDPAQYCVALYDFVPERPDEMSLQAGDRIRIIRHRSNDWWEGELGGLVGLFPTNYVTLASP